LDRYVCIHGHFYQPPRENPWLEAIELQDSAYPYHDWNARIDAECYAPNSASRILDSEGRIASIVNNYAHISYNFGPTLLAWMQDQSPETYRSVVEADRRSVERFSGHGSALAQPYNHMIMPLANRRDKYTQVRWGIRDFERRFGRPPEGMWLPETAVDLETLDILAEHGIRFTVLEPCQARRVREKRHLWRDVTGGRIDPTTVYRVRLPSWRRIAVFFYDGPISRACAFEGLLDSGENLAGRLGSAFSNSRTWPQLVHIATDGETYGHHHRHGEMALSYALKYIEEKGIARLANYGEYLEKCSPTWEVQIYENTSWSCAHGVERWRSDCGCNSGRSGWNQEWRKPLREAFDWLRDQLAPYYEQTARERLKDPWTARDAYIDVVLDRSPESRERFFAEHASRPLSPLERVSALKLLELQRHTMLMYTSCGWFFDEISGIETVQVIQYAGRALQLAKELGGPDLEEAFLNRLECARSNVPEYKNGRVIYDRFVRPAMVDLQKVGAHYAIASIFDNGAQQRRVYSYTVEREDHRLYTAGKARMALGKAKVVSEVTGESGLFSYGVVHLGEHTVSGGVRAYRDEAHYLETLERITGVFRQGDFPELIRVVDREYGPGAYSLKLLFRDEQRHVVRLILENSLRDAEVAYRHIYENNVALMRFLKAVGMPAPKRLEVAAEVTLNSDLRGAFENDDLDFGRIAALVDEASTAGVPFDAPTLEFALRGALERIAGRLAAHPADLATLEKLNDAAAMARSLPFEVAFWRAQNVYYRVMREEYPAVRARAAGEESARLWVERFRELGDRLRVRVE